MSSSDTLIKNISFDPSTVGLLIDELRKVSKIKLECYKREFLERRIKARIYRLNFTSDKEYLAHVSKNPSEINELSDLFTINYTYFFRNNDVYQKFKRYYLAKKLKLQDPKKIRIWSAACSTGEEPYSIAILFDYLKKLKLNIDIPDVEIIASDIDHNVIKLAKKGVFNEYSVHDLPDIYKSYFTNKSSIYGPQYIISDEIKKKVRFVREDLTSEHRYKFKYDIIFCRNFLIYLNKFFQRKVYENFSKHLLPGGLLVLGKTEIISDKDSTHFSLVDPKNHIYAKI
ncbi:MAG: CheR family methyltransferase [Promethearchaeota archaeon]